MKVNLCPVCRTQLFDSGGGGDKLQLDCPRCGKFEISGTARALLGNRLQDQPRAWVRLSHAIRLRTELTPWLEVNSYNLDALLAERLPDYLKQRSLLLRWLAKTIRENENEPIKTLDDRVAAIIGVASAADVRHHISELSAEGLIRENLEAVTGVQTQSWQLTAAGWREADRSSEVQEANLDEYDLFISHASNDKVPFVDSLVSALVTLNLRVWYDSMVLQIGDSLRRSIDRGLGRSRFGVVVLSPSFFARDWPQRELDGLAALETIERPRILPLWHGVTRADVARYSPMLADKFALLSSMGATEIAAALQERLRRIDG